MRKYSSIEVFEDQRPSGTSWERCSQALSQLPGLNEDAAHSIGDSLTYFRSARPAPRPEEFVGHRRYRFVLTAMKEPVSVEVAAKAELTNTESYSDLTDREHFTGQGQMVTLEPGEVLVMDIDEAVRFPQPCPVVGVVHLTIEAATFHNK